MSKPWCKAMRTLTTSGGASESTIALILADLIDERLDELMGKEDENGEVFFSVGSVDG